MELTILERWFYRNPAATSPVEGQVIEIYRALRRVLFFSQVVYLVGFGKTINSTNLPHQMEHYLGRIFS